MPGSKVCFLTSRLFVLKMLRISVWHLIEDEIIVISTLSTLGSRGFFFLIDTEAALTQKKKAARRTSLRREPSVSIRKKYPLEPRVYTVRNQSSVALVGNLERA